MYQRIEEWRVVERRDGCVYRTVKVRDWYLKFGAKWPEDSGDTRWAPTSDRHLVRDPNPEDILK